MDVRHKNLNDEFERMALRRFRYLASKQIAALLGGLFLITVLPASAGTIHWTDWTSEKTGSTSGSAVGTISGLGIIVSYTGEVQSLPFIPSWGPSTSYVGGTVGNAPPQGNNAVALVGHTGGVDTLTFSAPVVNPVMAIFSLGSGSVQARFVFNSSEPFAIEAGGPSTEFVGSSIFMCGDNSNAICGTEGNGTVQFNGTYDSITWTNPNNEFWYAFTAGAPALAPPVPEPSSLLLLGTGLLAVMGAATQVAVPVIPYPSAVAGITSA